MKIQHERGLVSVYQKDNEMVAEFVAEWGTILRIYPDRLEKDWNIAVLNNIKTNKPYPAAWIKETTPIRWKTKDLYLLPHEEIGRNRCFNFVNDQTIYQFRLDGLYEKKADGYEKIYEMSFCTFEF